MLIDQIPLLKKAVIDLPPAEKDKLLLKLISKDPILVFQLEYKLLEDERDLDNRVDNVKIEIDKKISWIDKYLSQERNYSPGYFMMDVREMSGLVNEHVLITKHKISEVELRVYILEGIINCSANILFLKRTRHSEKLLAYFAGRVKNVLEKYVKLHEDLQFDFRDRINMVLDYANKTAIKEYLEALQLPNEV
ncbi:hypothetical protein EZJ43_02270 [Pedobacter changchengzhani]|uniref:Uncharacterized protein n=1 Tax=Pedobacter changchengzhani TaxID=2529274 RepID=A0A4R5MQH6_9SPHI|nr:hypothetical protein [Pedobacter changchengzhani]TDG37936.1 hypothetical protein EZJ43_02270 [Pedobacter changchengzhani]